MDFSQLNQWFEGLASGWQLGLWFLVGSYTIGLVLMYLIIVWLPEDYLLDESRWYRHLKKTRPWLYWLVFLLKNALGLLLVVAGIIMLFLPGQGVLTLFLGVLLLDFPGKHKLVLKILSQPAVLKAINCIRQWAGKPPLLLPDQLQNTH